jgi:hypothetical protein
MPKTNNGIPTPGEIHGLKDVFTAHRSIEYSEELLAGIEALQTSLSRIASETTMAIEFPDKNPENLVLVSSGQLREIRQLTPNGDFTRQIIKEFGESGLCQEYRGPIISKVCRIMTPKAVIPAQEDQRDPGITQPVTTVRSAFELEITDSEISAQQAKICDILSSVSGIPVAPELTTIDIATIDIHTWPENAARVQYELDRNVIFTPVSLGRLLLPNQIGRP